MRGGKWSTPAIAENAGIAHNTTIRCINEWRKELHGYTIEDERVPEKSYNRYWLVQIRQREEDKDIEELRELLKACDNALLTYPETCQDRRKIEIQREEVWERLLAASAKEAA